MFRCISRQQSRKRKYSKTILPRKNMRLVSDMRPAVIVIGPPWLRTGTGRVLEAQLAYYRDRGYRTAFIGVAVDPGHIASDPIWRRFTDAMGDLGADCVTI